MTTTFLLGWPITQPVFLSLTYVENTHIYIQNTLDKYNIMRNKQVIR